MMDMASLGVVDFFHVVSGGKFLRVGRVESSWLRVLLFCFSLGDFSFKILGVEGVRCFGESIWVVLGPLASLLIRYIVEVLGIYAWVYLKFKNRDVNNF